MCTVNGWTECAHPNWRGRKSRTFLQLNGVKLPGKKKQKKKEEVLRSGEVTEVTARMERRNEDGRRKKTKERASLRHPFH